MLSKSTTEPEPEPSPHHPLPLFFYTGAYYISQAGLELVNLLSQPPNYWD